MCVCKSIKTTKLVQASTIACSSSAMLEQHGSTLSTRSSRLARLARLARQSRTCRVVSSRDEPSGIWAIYSRFRQSLMTCLFVVQCNHSAVWTLVYLLVLKLLYLLTDNVSYARVHQYLNTYLPLMTFHDYKWLQMSCHQCVSINPSRSAESESV